MKEQSSSVLLPTKLSKGCKDFEQWRSQKQIQGKRIPKYLWQLAVELANEFGVSKTAKILRLSHGTLKKKTKTQNHELSFVKWQPSATFANEQHIECTIECHGKQSKAIKIHIKGSQWPDLPGICNQLWNKQ